MSYWHYLKDKFIEYLYLLPLLLICLAVVWRNKASYSTIVAMLIIPIIGLFGSSFINYVINRNDLEK